MSLARSKPCPCTSKKTYGECCAPYHKGERPVVDAPSLVRARYAAFALGEIDFLYATLHTNHADRVKHTRERCLAAFRAASDQFKYMGLKLMESRPADEHGTSRVLYLARIFRKGTNVSFVELAEFAEESGAVRYLAGRIADASRGDRAELTIDGFVADARG